MIYAVVPATRNASEEYARLVSLVMLWDCFVMVENMLGGREKLNVILSNLLFKDEYNYLAGRISINAK